MMLCVKIFLVKMLLKQDVEDNDSYADYYDDSPAIHEILGQLFGG